jgi:3-hydroxymyristoyl/3-hydroxydecanoyl-(acyl carrier protein) dehydratase
MTIDSKHHFCVPRQHPCYKDHFPEQTLVPGALMLHWIRELVTTTFGDHDYEIKAFKFLAPILPGDDCLIQFKKPKNTIMIECYKESTLIASGKFIINDRAHTFL